MDRKNYSSIFSILIALSIFLLLLWKAGAFNFVSGVINKVFSSPKSFLISRVANNNNLDLVKISKNLEITKLEKDNHALSDQFAVSNPNPQSLLPSKIIGSPSFIPGSSLPDFFILDKGESDGVKVGDAVVYQNNLIGQISQTNSYSSKVILIINESTSFTGKLESGAVGVVKGKGGGLEITNVLASENLKSDQVVLSKGSQNLNGVGIPPDLIVGKIVSVDHDPSALFQTAQIQSLVDFSKIDMVFVVIK